MFWIYEFRIITTFNISVNKKNKNMKRKIKAKLQQGH